MIEKEFLNILIEYDSITEIGSVDKLFIVSRGSKHGLVDKTGNIILDLIYSAYKAWAETEDYIAFKKENKYGLYSINEREFVTDFISKDISYICSEDCFIDDAGKIIKEADMIKKDILEKTYKHITEGNPNTLKTGFPDMDTMLANVDYGSIITISSRSAMGKTSFILNIMYNLLKQDKKCLFFTQNIGMEGIIKRLLSHISDVSLSDIRHRENLTNEQIESLREAVEELSKLNVTVLEYKFNTEQIRKEIELNTPEYVFIESVDVMDNSKSDLMSELKSIARENNCIIFSTCKLTEKVEEREDKRPVLSDLKETLKGYQASDVIIFIHRDSYYTPIETDERYNTQIIVAQNKNGCCGEFKLLYKDEKFYNPELAKIKG